VLLVLHAVAGTLALLVGPLALAGVRRAGLPYRVLVLAVAVSALLLTAASTLPLAVRVALGVVAFGSAAGVLAGSVRGLRGSYVALVAALAFVSGPVWLGVLVVVVGSAAVHGLPVGQPAPASAGRRGSNSSIG
jgi:ABC-type dipeptide/oligopeptide/nickel transport system permease component